eukprot:scaffold6539_cov103-Isochrysis_galbana.AAC.2
MASPRGTPTKKARVEAPNIAYCVSLMRVHCADIARALEAGGRRPRRSWRQDGGGEFAVGGEDPIGFGVAEPIGQRTEVLVAVAGGASVGAAGEVGKSMGELHRHQRRGDAGIGWKVPVPGWMLGLELIHHGGDDRRHPIGVEHAEAACDLAPVDEVEGTGEGSVLGFRPRRRPQQPQSGGAGSTPWLGRTPTEQGGGRGPRRPTPRSAPQSRRWRSPRHGWCGVGGGARRRAGRGAT